MMAERGRPDKSIVTGRALALYDYDGNASDELSFNAGDSLDILSPVPSDAWYEAFNTRSRQQGLVPSNYIQLLPETTEEDYDLTISTNVEAAEDDYGDVTISTNVLDEDSPQSDKDNNNTQGDVRTASGFGTVIDDHNPGGETELRVVKGNMVEVLHEPLEDWVWVKDITSKQEGYIPIDKLHRKEKIKKTNISDALQGLMRKRNSHTRLSSESTSSGARSSSGQSGEDSILSNEHTRISSGSSSSGVGGNSSQIVLSDEDIQNVVLRRPQENNVTIPRSADYPSQNTKESTPDQTINGIARLICDKGSHKEGEEVEVVDASNPEHTFVKHVASGQEFFVKNEDLDFTASNHDKISSTPPPISRKPKPSPIAPILTNDSPTLPTPPISQETPTEQAVHGVARLKCAKEPGKMKKGDEVEILEPHNSDYTFVRHKSSKIEFYIKREELDFTSKFTTVKPSQSLSPPLITQDQKPNVPPKPDESKDQGSRRRSPLPTPPTKELNLPPKPGRKANSREMEKVENLEEKEYYVNTNVKTEIRSLLFGPGGKDGTFIVRNSGTVDGEYAISVRHLDTVKHYRIKRDDSGLFYVNDGETFHKVVSLVTHYMNNGGLEHKLVTPFRRVMM